MSDEPKQPDAQAEPQAADATEPAAATPAGEIDPSTLDALATETANALDQQFGNSGEAATAATQPAAGAATAVAQPYQTPQYDAATRSDKDSPIDLLDDVELDVRIELGRTEMYIEDVLRLDVDSVVELDKLAGDPVDIYVSDRLMARGEVLVLNECFCVRISEILSPIPELEND